MSKEKPGPTSEIGKRIASQNAAKHNMTGRVLLIKGEDQSDLDALLAQWQNDYPTDTVEAAKLVQEAANSEWILLRVQRQSDKAFKELYEIGMEAWGDDEHKRYQLTQRYLTAAERKLDRNRRNIWQYRRELRAEARERRDAQRYQDASEPESTPEPEEKNDMPMTQIAFVSVKNGLTVTSLQPPNETILRGHGLFVEETFVKRQIRFECAEVPVEYAFCLPELAKRQAPLAERRITVLHTLRTFTTAIEREAASGGHVQFWPDLYAQDKKFIEEALAKECPLDE
jgi:hypothetical protein